jgi:hypothetical protein
MATGRGVEMTKQTARMSQVALVRGVNGFYLTGRVKDHPRQAEFMQPYQRTSKLVNIDLEAGTAETENTIYTLE